MPDPDPANNSGCGSQSTTLLGTLLLVYGTYSFCSVTGRSGCLKNENRSETPVSDI